MVLELDALDPYACRSILKTFCVLHHSHGIIHFFTYIDDEFRALPFVIVPWI